MDISRRDLIKSGVVVAGSLVLPISVGARELTKVDRKVLGHLSPHGDDVLSQVEVDERLMARMSLRSIGGVPIEVVRDQPTFTQHGGHHKYITYYRATYNEGIPDRRASRACFFPPDAVDYWLQRKSR